MTRKVFSFLLGCTLAALLSTGYAVAEPVSLETAKLVAGNWLYEQTGRYPSEAVSAEQADMPMLTAEAETADNVPYRIIAFDSGGWVIVSGDDIAYPVIGYNTKGKAPTAPLPPPMQAWLDMRAKEIKAAVSYANKAEILLSSTHTAASDTANNKISKKNNATWKRLTSAPEEHQSTAAEALVSSAELSNSTPASVEPLLGDIKWGQNEFYNDACPLNGKNQRARTGCVATAMGQIMKYWGARGLSKAGTDQTSYMFNGERLSVNFAREIYNWDKMPTIPLNGPNDQVAKLLYHAGVAVEMTYHWDPAWSLATPDLIPTALIKYFNFHPNAKLVQKEDYTEEKWANLLTEELNNQRPVIYTGYNKDDPEGQYGHTFICDGYRTTDGYKEFYFKFGFKGDGDAYYRLDDITPPSGNFTFNQLAVISIEKDTISGTAADLIIPLAFTTIKQALPEQDFLVNVQVDNVGDGSSPVTNLNIYLTTSSTITDKKIIIGNKSLQPIDAFTDSLIYDVQVHIPDVNGKYYLTACTESFSGERSNENNCKKIESITISGESMPDVSLENFTVSDDQVYSGQKIQLQAKVKNTGNTDIPDDLTVKYYMSSNKAISTGDTLLTSYDTIPYLAINQSVTTDTYATPTSAMYYGACVGIWKNDLDTSTEIDSTNNCSNGILVQVTSEAPTESPDLIFDNITFSTSELQPGQSFKISAKVKNKGTANADSTILKYYFSSDFFVTDSDIYLGENNLSALLPGETTEKTINAIAPAAAGSYWIGAIVDAVVDEVNLGNNYSHGFQIKVGLTGGGSSTGGDADLIVTEPHVNCNALGRGQTTRLYATVKNQGTDTSSSSTVRYYISEDDSISASDILLVTQDLDGLSAEAVASVEKDVRAPNTTGDYWVGVCVDPAGESVTTNNCSSAVRIRVKDTPDWWSDYAVTGIQVQDITPTLNYSWVNVNATVTIKNFGNTSGGFLYPRIYWSADRWIEPGIDTELESDELNFLDGGEERTYTFTNSSSNRAGSLSSGSSYWVGVCVDAANLEIITSNNCSPAVQVWVGNNAAWSPDLLPSSPELSQTIIPQGSNFDASLTVENIGSSAAESGSVKIVRSNDSAINVNDTSLATWPIGQLGNIPFAANTQLATSSWSAGTYYIGTCVYNVSGEQNTGNNCSAGVKVEIGDIPNQTTVPNASDGTYGDKVRVTWTSTDADYYKLFRCLTASGDDCWQLETPITGPYDDFAAVPGITYWYQLETCNEFGCRPPAGNDAGHRMQSPALPIAPVATDGTLYDKIEVSWESAEGASEYQLFRCESSSDDSCDYLTSNNNFFYEDTDTTPSVVYYYRVIACNDAGCSAYSQADPGHSKSSLPIMAAMTVIQNIILSDIDGDGVVDSIDNCMDAANPDQLDTDNDTQGNACDTDDDNDGVSDDKDAFPLDASESLDTDGDGIGNNADPDDDNDGVNDTIDNCPLLTNSDQKDQDGDGIGSVCDEDEKDSMMCFPVKAANGKIGIICL